MELILFIDNIITAYLFGYAVFFILSKFIKYKFLDAFIDCTENKIPSFGIIYLINVLIGLFITYLECSYEQNSLCFIDYPGEKIFKSFWVYSLIGVLFVFVPTQFFFFQKVLQSTKNKLFLIVFFLLDFDWLISEIEVMFHFIGSKSFNQFFDYFFYFKLIKSLVVYLILNFFIFKFFNRNVKP